MKNISALLVMGFFLPGLAFGDAPLSCPQNMVWQKICVSGEMMLCNKGVVDNNNYIFSWRAVNEHGQPFNVYSPYYKKIAGYTPAKCTDTASKFERLALQD